MDGGKLHIVVFPWLAFGHMLPFLELSKSLAKRGHRISFISTPRNIQRLPKIPPQLSPLIHLVALPLPPASPGLPDEAEATSDVAPDQIPHLKKAFDGLEQPFARFIEASSSSPRKPDWIIHDFTHHWLPLIASASDVPCVLFCPVSAPMLVYLNPERPPRSAEQLTAPPEWIPFPSRVAYRLHEARHLVEAYKEHALGVSDAYRFTQTLRGCKAMALRSCMEFESDWLSLLQEICKKPVIPIGLLPPLAEPTGNADTAAAPVNIMRWLDRQAPGSVVYVALGTEAALSAELVHELAFGLELSELHFLWALRRPNGSGGIAEMLPEGFEERTGGRGVVAMGWVPQLEVLGHAAVGGFLTHCGWSSIIEGLQFGHPLVLLPISVDQGLNARVMEERRIGVEVERDEEDGSFTKEVVARAVRLVMVEEGGEEFRVKAKEMRGVFADKGCHERYVDAFVQYLSSDHTS